ncbi:D-alanyl-D-alanine carboxypeptidase family protein [Streptomyces sp. NBRC 109706]|uniref:D-alanyl-D-alanine carboxypeptidase family protein n=1 Tax=Streptomyces sp. NBRC 109706 TaxID=1550035 RepID=UPI00078342F3|nr:serine hydrolase [Streptomyces sp. NBRC 109706]
MKVPEDENEKAGKPAEGDGREGAADAGAEGIAEASPGDAEDRTEDAQGAAQAPGAATVVMRAPKPPEDEDEAAGDRDDRLTRDPRVSPAEVREADEADENEKAAEADEKGEAAGEAEGDDASADGGDHATTMLRLPASADEGADAGDRLTTELRVPAEPPEDEKHERAEADEADDAAEGDDASVDGGDHATTMLRLPASADEGADAGDRLTTELRVPAEPPEDEKRAEADESEEEAEAETLVTTADDLAETLVDGPPDAEKPADEPDEGDKGDEADKDEKGGGGDATTMLRLPVAEKAADPEADDPDEPDETGDADASGKPAGKSDVTAVLPAPGDAPPEPPAPPAKPTPAKPTPKPAVPPPPAEAPPPADSQRDPLELLAALTNRPPPPPTPLRTALRRVKIWTPLVLLLLVVFVTAQLLRPLPEPDLSLSVAETHTLAGELDAVPWPASGQARVDVVGLGTLGSSGGEEPVPIASVAKVMTAYVILRDHPMEAEEELGAMIPVDQQAEDDAALGEEGNESIVEVTAGTELSQREALQAVMIASANNVARLLARWDAGSEEEFVAKMNEAAAELGMENTTYTDPSGLRPETVSTAADQVRLAKAVMEDPVFRQVVRMPNYEDSEGRLHYNWNHLVPMNGVIGIKPGTTTTAGGNLMFAAEQEVGGTTQLIVGAVLAQPPHPSDNSILTGALTASDELIRFAQGQLTDEPLFAAGDTVGEVDDGLGGSVPVVVTEDVPVVGWAGLEVRLSLTPSGDGVPGSAEAGEVVGTLSVGGGEGSVEVPVALADDLAEPGFGARLTRVG